MVEQIGRHPIATAPTDGTRVLLFHARDLQEQPVSGVYAESEWFVSTVFLVPGPGGKIFMSTCPTHWAPVVVR